jgi:hypothetical protein
MNLWVDPVKIVRIRQHRVESCGAAPPHQFDGTLFSTCSDSLSGAESEPKQEVNLRQSPSTPHI